MIKQIITLTAVACSIFVAACEKSPSSLGEEALKIVYERKLSAINAENVSYKNIECSLRNVSTNYKSYDVYGTINIKQTIDGDIPSYSIKRGDKVLSTFEANAIFRVGSTGIVDVTSYGVREVGLKKL